MRLLPTDMIVAWMMCKQKFIPVSYTHLDVYKRQEQQGGRDGEIVHEAGAFLPADTFQEDAVHLPGKHPVAVSYTHLDVYKRQSFRREG